MTYIETSWMIAITVFSIKHFIADFVLQTDYMLGKFKAPPYCFKPLAAHCGVHALFTAILLFVPVALDPLYLSNVWLLIVLVSVYDFITHFMVDIAKAQYTRIKKLTPAYKSYWVAIGIDQMGHLILSIPMIMLMSLLIQVVI